MSYTIVKSDGQVLTTIADGQINTTSTSLGLPGRNYAGYGQVLDTNFTHMLENFASTEPPANPLRGQLWYNTNNQTLYVCPSDGETVANLWLALASTSASGSTTLGSVTVTGNLTANNATITNNLQSANIACQTLSVAENAQIDAATTRQALMTIAFVAVLREGLETVLFLISAETSSSSGSSVVVGGLLGLVVAAVLGRVVYLGGNRLKLSTFFNVTGALLILFAAGLFGKFFHEYRELLGMETGWLVQSVWTIESGPWASGTFYDFMKGFFGWHNAYENIRLIAYFAYLIPVGYLFLRGAGAPPSSAAPSKEKESVSA